VCTCVSSYYYFLSLNQKYPLYWLRLTYPQLLNYKSPMQIVKITCENIMRLIKFYKIEIENPTQQSKTENIIDGATTQILSKNRHNGSELCWRFFYLLLYTYYKQNLIFHSKKSKRRLNVAHLIIVEQIPSPTLILQPKTRSKQNVIRSKFHTTLSTKICNFRA